MGIGRVSVGLLFFVLIAEMGIHFVGVDVIITIETSRQDEMSLLHEER